MQFKKPFYNFKENIDRCCRIQNGNFKDWPVDRFSQYSKQHHEPTSSFLNFKLTLWYCKHFNKVCLANTKPAE